MEYITIRKQKNRFYQVTEIVDQVNGEWVNEVLFKGRVSKSDFDWAVSIYNSQTDRAVSIDDSHVMIKN